MKGIYHVVLFCAAPLLASAETISACNPYTFIGRVMDFQHDAFGSNRVAKIETGNCSKEFGYIVADSICDFSE